MKSEFYRLRRTKRLSGVCAGLADKFGWDLLLTRVVTALLIYFTRGTGLFIYILLSLLLPYKEDLEQERYGTGPRRRKDAEVINDDDGWFW